MAATESITKLERALTQSGITEREAIALIHSAPGKPYSRQRVKATGQHVKYGYISDTHIGQRKFKDDLFYQAAEHFNKEKVDFVLHPGDHVEGMSGRPGHVYELNLIGFQAQVNRAAQLYKEINATIYGIDGNHDHWYVQKGDAGAYVGRTLAGLVKNFKHLGEWEGDLLIGNHLKIKMLHAGDGTAYADSYKLQKRIESFTPGEKPHIFHEGHYHKALYEFRRNVHGFESGTLCGQTGWMRGKGIQAHLGYGVVDVHFDKTGVHKLVHQFVPGFE
jgi:predicted phosphodiesterase